jgi:hypothetical protein
LGIILEHVGLFEEAKILAHVLSSRSLREAESSGKAYGIVRLNKGIIDSNDLHVAVLDTVVETLAIALP